MFRNFIKVCRDLADTEMPCRLVLRQHGVNLIRRCKKVVYAFFKRVFNGFLFFDRFSFLAASFLFY